MSYKGWNEVEFGVILSPMQENGVEALEKQPEDRKYTEFSSYTQSVAYWRVNKPIYNAHTCINCLFCWVYCPDASIIARDGNMSNVDYTHCKGCGICAQVCPSNPKSLIMFNDREEPENALKSWPEKK